MAFGRRVRAALAIAVMLWAACGKAAKDREINYSSDPDALIVRIERVGGFLPGEHRLRELPMFSLYGDGRVFTLGAQIEIYPPPALQPLVVKKLSPKGIQAILNLARAAGLMDGDEKIDNPTIMDASTTVFTVNASGSHRVEVYALDEAISDIDDERARLQVFQRKVTDLGWMPKGSVLEDEAPAEPERLQVIAFIPDPQQGQDEGINPGTRTWPLSAPVSSIGTPYGSDGISGRYAVLEGDQLSLMISALRESNELTIWTSEGKSYRVINKPLLPRDEGCVARRS